MLIDDYAYDMLDYHGDPDRILPPRMQWSGRGKICLIFIFNFWNN